MIVIDLDINQIPNRPINIQGERNRKESLSDSELTSSESEQSDFDNSVEQVTTLQNHYDEIADSEFINFKMNIPTWGSLIKYKGISDVYVTNTSPVNYFLLAFWLIFSRNPNIFNNLPSNDSKFILIEIIEMIDKKNSNKAIELWINSIMVDGKNLNFSMHTNHITMHGTEKNCFLVYLNDFQKHRLIKKCTISCNLNDRIMKDISYDIFFKKSNQKIILFYFNLEKWAS